MYAICNGQQENCLGLGDDQRRGACFKNKGSFLGVLFECCGGYMNLLCPCVVGFRAEGMCTPNLHPYPVNPNLTQTTAIAFK